MTRISGLLCSAAFLWSAGCATVDLGRVQPNDNTRAAGTLESGALHVALETRVGRWLPEGDGGRVIDSVVAFAEPGRAPSTPGPLLRVPVGTRVHGTIHNTLSRPLTVLGLGATRHPTDTLVVPAGATTPFEFTADQPGTFIYEARTRVDTVYGRDPREMQLQGVLVVDRPDAPPDRIMGISWYYTVIPGTRTGLGAATMAINGLSWPHTEHLSYTQGDSVHWRVVNFTESDHPMHLHGFYFRVDGHSAGGSDSSYTADQQRMAVTEVVQAREAVELSWMADRPGNWVYHCHYATHVSPAVELDTKDGSLDTMMLRKHMSDRPHQMYGLVMGITVAPRGPQATALAPERIIRIEQRKKEGVYGDEAGMSYSVRDGQTELDTAAMPVPAPALVLERGKRVQVTVVNESDEHAAVHWHGIELESYPDGVPGWSGSGKEILPAILPHDSLTVRWTPPRAGSFMYHSHFNEARQMGGGLYGPIIVVDSGQRFDPETDRILFFGTAGPVVNLLGAPPAVLLNGSAHPAPMEFTVGRTYRLRLFDLAGDNPTLVSITDNGKPVQWRAVAKDGYDLPASQATVRPATLMFDPGEIYDFEFTPTRSGELTLSFGLPLPPAKPDASPPPAVVTHVALHVR